MSLLRGVSWDGGDLRVDASVVDDADLVFVQRDFPRYAEAFEQVLERTRTRRKPLVYDMDDLLTEVPVDHPEWHSYRPLRGAILWAISEADAVTASTPVLCEALQSVNPYVWLLPNYLDDQFWPEVNPTVEAEKGRVSICYMGTHTHGEDLAIIIPALRAIAERYPDTVVLKFLGAVDIPDALADLPNIQHAPRAFVDYRQFAAWFSTCQCDIGIAPLRDDLFNNCKSNLKYLEYSILAMPGVYSRVAPYASVVKEDNGLLAGSPAEWETALNRLITEVETRRAMGERARDFVRAQWMLSAHAGEWLDTYRQIIGAYQSERPRASSAVTAEKLRAWQKDDAAELVRQFAEIELMQQQLDEQLPQDQDAHVSSQLRQLRVQIVRQEEMIRWLEADREQMRRSITWRGTEPVRQVYSRLQKTQRLLAERRAGAAIGDGAVDPAPQVGAEVVEPLQSDAVFWTPERLAQVTVQPTSSVTDIVITVGRDANLIEKCVAAIRQSTSADAYRLHLVVHEQDLPQLSERVTAGAQIYRHTMEQFNFARANNLALARCEGDVVLLNDDTEVTPGWLELLRADSRGFALTGARTGVERAGNPDMYGEGESRLTEYPINMFCAFIPQRVREVVGLLDEEYAYYGGEDVDYSAKACQNGFPLVVSSAYVHHVGAKSFGAHKLRLIQESDKILRERYDLWPPYRLTWVKPLVSVIVATRNRADKLPAAIRAVLGSEYAEIEVIIVDDASTDETAAVVAGLQQEDSRIIGIRLPQQSGSVRARQRGLMAAQGQFIAYVDDDDTAWPNRISAPLQFMLARPELDVVYCAFDIVSESGRQHGRTQPFDLDDYLAVKFDIGCPMLFMRRQVMLDVPFMDHYERAVDFDWVFRVLRHGYRIGYCPTVVVDYNRFGPGEAHLSGNPASEKTMREIQERERLMGRFKRK